MDNNLNMFPEDPQNNNGTPDDSDDIDFGETLEEFENLIGTDAPENGVNGDIPDDNEDSGGDAASEGADESGNDLSSGVKEKKEHPKLSFENRSVSGIARGIRDWVVASWRALTTRGKIILCASTAAALLLIIIAVVLLNRSPYVATLGNLEQTDAAVAMGILDVNRINYRYEREPSGLITLYTRERDEPRALSAIVGAGFQNVTIFVDEEVDSGGLFETAEDKRMRYKDNKERRLRATLNAMDGIADSIVTLVIPDNSTNVLIREKEPSEASVMLILKQDVTLSEDMVKGIESMIVSAVENLDAEHVTILDNFGNQLNIYTEDIVDSLTDNMTMLEMKNNYERGLESELEAKATRILASFYPQVEVGVSVRTNFDKIVREVTSYHGANFDEETGEYRGIVSAEASDQMLGSQNREDVMGVIGTDANVDATGYYEALDEGLELFAAESHFTKEYLVGKIIEQLERTTPELTHISVWANADGRAPEDEELENFIYGLANVTGISELARAQMGEDDEYDTDYLRQFVTLSVRTFYSPADYGDFDPLPIPGLFGLFEFWLALGGIMILIVMVSVMLVAISRRAKRIREEEQQILAELGPAGEHDHPLSEIDPFTLAISRTAVADEIGGGEVSLEVKEENLKKQIRIFVDQNPEIAAQLVKTLLKGDETNA